MQDSREFSQLKQKSNSSNEIPCLHCVLLVVELSTDNCTYMRNYRNISCNIYYQYALSLEIQFLSYFAHVTYPKLHEFWIHLKKNP